MWENLWKEQEYIYSEVCGLAKIWPNVKAEGKLFGWIATFRQGEVIHSLNNWDLNYCNTFQHCLGEEALTESGILKNTYKTLL